MSKSKFLFPGDLETAYPGTKRYWRKWASECYEVPVTPEVSVYLWSNSNEEDAMWYCVHSDGLEFGDADSKNSEHHPYIPIICGVPDHGLEDASPLDVISYIEEVKQKYTAA